MQSGIDEIKAEIARMRAEIANVEKQIAIAKKNNPDEADMLVENLKIMKQALSESESALTEMVNESEESW